MTTIKRSIFWAAIEQTGPQIIGFFSSIILARLLVPADYGLVGMIAIFMAFGNLFADAGMSQALIQRQDVTKDDEKSVFVLNIVVGMVMTLLMCAISPFVANFFKEPKLIPIMCVQSLGFTLSAFGIIQYTLLSRNLDLHKTALASLISTITGGAGSITMALMGMGVWSLVGGFILGTLGRVISLWFISNWRPIGQFSMNSIRSIWKYSGHLLGAGVYTTFVDNLANVLIGRSYSASSLGLYTRANQLQLLPVSLLTGIINRVAFPVFSRNQNDKEALLIHLRQSIRISLFITCFVCILLVVIADPLVPWLFGEQWNGSIKFLQILSFSGIFYPINVLLITSVKSVGRSDLFFKVEIIKKTIIMVALLVAVQFSIEAMAISLFFTGAAAYFFNARFTVPLLNYKWKNQFADIIPIWIIMLLSGTFTYIVTYFIPTEHAILTMLKMVIIYTLFVIIAIYALRKSYLSDIWNYASNIIRKLRISKSY